MDRTHLSEAKRTLLERRLAGRRAVAEKPLESSPLASKGMERLWFLHQVEPEAPIYNIYCHYRILGPLDLERLQESWSRLVERHPILRIRLRQSGERLLREPVEPAALEIMPEDGGELAQRLREVRRRPFDPARGPLSRLAVLKLGSDEYVLSLVLHHLICDGWTLDLLERELGRLYSGEELPPLGLDYGHFVAWQASLDVRREAAYWKRRLKDLPRCEVAPDYSRPPRPRFGCQQLSLAVEAGPVKQLASDLRTTLFTLLLTVFKGVLARWVGQRDLVVGTPMAGRLQPGFERVAGFFVNTLILRTRLAGNDSFAELVSKVHETVLDAHEHQRLPFEQLVQELKPERDGGRNPLFSVVFVTDEGPRQVIPLSGLRVEPLEFKREALPYDLEARCTDLGDVIRVTLYYDPALYGDDTIGEMLRHFVQALGRVTSAPETVLAEWSGLTPRWLDQLEERLCGPRVDHPAGCLHQRFEEQVERTPDAVAVIDQGRSFTYAELNRAANRLAHELIAKGVGKGHTVSVRLPRSYQAVATLLGVAKTGAAYLPLGLHLPEAVAAERSAQVGAELRLESGCPKESGADHNPGLEVDPEDLLCWLFTSASTGPAKAVGCPHLGAVHRLDWGRRCLPLEPGEVVGQRAGLGFVDSISEIFTPLLSGACLSILPDMTSVSGWLGHLREQRVSRLLVVPSLLEELLRQRLELPDLKLVICSGEALTSALLEQFEERLPGARLVNLYGSTEVAGDVTWSQDESLGWPIDNHRLAIVDSEGCPVAPGASGELVVAGPGLAHGLGEAYATGDLVRLDRRGRLEYLGRRDRQVKIRGVRVSLAGVEQCLSRHPAVWRCAVVDRQNCLHAFWVGDFSRAAELELYLQTHLERAQRPRLHSREQLPLTSNGKIDRTALEVDRRDPARKGTPFEEKVRALWSECLGFEVDLEGNFFDLGGHSLLGLRLVSALEELVGEALGVGLLFQAQTPLSMAALLQRPGETEELVVVRPGEGPALVLFPPAGCTLMRYTHFLEYYHGHVCGFEFPKTVVHHDTLVQRWVEELVRKVPGPYFLGGACLGGRFALEVARRLKEEGREVALLVLIDPFTPRRKKAKFWLLGILRQIHSPSLLVERVQAGLAPSDFQKLQRIHRASILGVEPQPAAVPGLLIQSGEDRKWRDRELDWNPLLSSLETKVLRGTTHFGIFDDPEQAARLARVVGDGLARHGR